MAWDQKRRTPADYIERHKAQRVLIAHDYVCHLCGHGQAEQVDHVIPWAEWTIPNVSPHDAVILSQAGGQHRALRVDVSATRTRARQRPHEAPRDARRVASDRSRLIPV